MSQDIFANMDAGKERLDLTVAKSNLVLPETSQQGQDLIREELSMLTTEYDGFIQDCDELQDALGISAFIRTTCQILHDEYFMLLSNFCG